MAKKRIKELAREHDMPAKEVIDRLVSAGLEVKGPASAVDEDQAKRALAGLPIEQKARKEVKRPAVQQRIVRPSVAARASAEAAERERARKEAAARPATGARSLDPRRPTRSSLSTDRAPGQGAAGGRRRVVIDSQASRGPGGPGGPGRGPGGPQGPHRRPRRGGGRRRRADVIEETVDTLDVAAHQKTDLIRIASGSTVKDIAEYFGVGVAEVIKKLMMLGEMATLTQTLSDEAIHVLAGEFDREIEITSVGDEDALAPEFEDDDDDLEIRPPVITIMGHVDHGKTSLLDAIRAADKDVTAGEAGGITQHIGAYQVHHADNVITFLDTPGHEAFTAMRARGARVTDIAVIVVAADDGVKPQTVEAIDHAKAAGVPIVVAVNKIDKEGADTNRVRTEMTQRGLQPAEWGGEVEFVDVSAKAKTGIEDLLETLLVVADLQDIRANPEAEASGVVIESKLDPGRGPVATVLVQRGTMIVGDALVAGGHWGRVKALIDYTGKRVDEAGPGDPVEVLGFNSVPSAGEFVQEAESDKEARTKAEERALRLRQESQARRSGRKRSLEDLFSEISSGDLKELTVVLKGDVAGSVEAFEDEIARLPQDEVVVNIVHSGVGGITESDVNLAAASDAIVIGFNVRPVGDAKNLADREDVEIRTYSIIYRALEDIKQAMTGLLEPEEVEDALGTVEIRQIFKASKIGTIAGSYVTDGRVTRGSKVRVVRDATVIHEGEIESLRRFNDDAKEVASGYECGIVLKSFQDLHEGDILEVFTTRKVERELASR